MCLSTTRLAVRVNDYIFFGKQPVTGRSSVNVKNLFLGKVGGYNRGQHRAIPNIHHSNNLLRAPFCRDFHVIIEHKIIIYKIFNRSRRIALKVETALYTLKKFVLSPISIGSEFRIFRPRIAISYHVVDHSGGE